jgi:hypothetical protein
MHRLLILLIALSSCSSDKGYRFEAVYEAPNSGFQIKIISRGYITAGSDTADDAFARVSICPVVSGEGRPFRFSLTARPRAPSLFGSDDVLTANAEWSQNLLRSVLRVARYREPVAEELAGSYRVISNALSGPKGVVLEGQIESVKVVRAKAEYTRADLKGQPYGEWVGVSELGGCDTVKK